MEKNRVVPMRRGETKGPSASSRIFGTLIVLVIVAGLVLSAWFVFAISVPKKVKFEDKFVISKGEGVNQISQNLKDKGVIKNSFVFETYAFLKGVESKFQAASYDLPEVANIKRLVDILTTGQKGDEWELTVIEGLTVEEIADLLEEADKFESDEFLGAIGYVRGDRINFSSRYDFLKDKSKEVSLEGYLFPDTYRFFPDATIEDVVSKMLNNFDKKLTSKMREDIEKQDKIIFDIIIMASIIEREVRTEDDRPIVSGIFWNRFEAGRALQADSTVNYITGKKTPAVSLDDLQIDSAYNTYKYAGLTPGPISNPGIASIVAAIYPEDSEYWYFLTDKEGNVHYAEDFEKHVENKNKYLR